MQANRSGIPSCAGCVAQAGHGVEALKQAERRIGDGRPSQLRMQYELLAAYLQ
jgi:hypothetical protein